MAATRTILAAISCSGVLAAGCVTLLPTSPPAQLYRFGFEPPDAPAPEIDAVSPRFRVALASTSLPTASAGSGILTTHGDSVAYIAGARWATPAVDLVDEAAIQAFSATNISLTRAAAETSASLVLEVRTFETRYADASAPSVRIVIHAVLTQPDGRPFAERTFASEQRTDADRVTAIVAAYDRALSADLTPLASWSAATLSTVADARSPPGSARP